MSGNDRADGGGPELRSFRELESLIRSLGEELASFRRRAVAAEAQLRDSEAHSKGGPPIASRASGDTGAGLKAENDELRTRLERAEDRVRQMMDRVRFLRQQLQLQATGAGAAGARS